MEREKIIYKQYDKDNNLSYFKTYYKGTLHGSNITTKAKAVHRILQTNITSPLTYSFIEVDMNDDKFYNDINNHKVYFSCKADSFTTFVEINEHMFQLYKGYCGENDLIEAYNSSNRNIDKVIKLIFDVKKIKKAIDFVTELSFNKNKEESRSEFNIINSYIKSIDNIRGMGFKKWMILDFQYIDFNRYKKNKQLIKDCVGDSIFVWKYEYKKAIFECTLYNKMVEENIIDNFLSSSYSTEFDIDNYKEELIKRRDHLDTLYNYTEDKKINDCIRRIKKQPK